MANRLQLIDAIRGLAILAMIGFHFLFDVSYIFGWVEIDLFSFGWTIFARVVQFMFLGLVGVMSYRSWVFRDGLDYYKSQLTRAGKIMGMALVISVLSFIFFRDEFIVFGILHFIGAAVLILALIPKDFMLALLPVSVYLSYVVPNFDAGNDWWLMFGRVSSDFRSLDYFPILPWINVVVIGFLLGRYVLEFSDFVDDKIRVPKWILFLGRRSLLVYMVHQPILLGAMYLTSLVLGM